MIWQVGQRRELKLRSGESCAFQSSTEAEERGRAEEEEEEMAGDCMRMGKVEEGENMEEEEKGAEAAGLQLTIAATGRLPLLQLFLATLFTVIVLWNLDRASSPPLFTFSSSSSGVASGM